MFIQHMLDANMLVSSKNSSQESQDTEEFNDSTVVVAEFEKKTHFVVVTFHENSRGTAHQWSQTGKVNQLSLSKNGQSSN